MTKPTLIYAYDPLCGWCFGFHPVIEKIAERFRESLHIQVIPGGLAIDENAQTISEGYSYIYTALKQTEETTGVEFGENFKLLAEEGSYFYDSEPACIAQTVVNKLSPDQALTFAGNLHNALFINGENLNEPEILGKIADESGIDSEKFQAEYQKDSIRKETREMFEWCKKMGASAFPTLLLQIEEETGLISRGYRPFDTIESHLHHLLNNIKKLQDG